MCRKLLLVFSIMMLGLASSAWSQMPANRDVGNPALAGSVAAYDPVGGVWTIKGAGSDVWGTSDQFQYVFRPLAGDGSGVVRLVSMDVTNEWAKVGVMIRESLAANSKHVMISMTGSHGAQTVWRQETGGESASMELAGVALPLYLKIERIGNTINTYVSPNPAFWIPQKTLDIPMNANVYIGMFVCSHAAGTLCTAVFDQVTLTAPPYKTAWNLSPDAGTVLDPAGTTLSWSAGDTAASHDVYLGTSSPPALVGNQTGTSYATGALQGGKTYYWRIDEVEADGVTKHAGQEMTFKTVREGTGKILREVWEGIGGVAVSDLTNNANYPANPSYSDERTLLEAPIDFADNFGSRLHGWLQPETSGDYTFWISSDDGSDLYLSTTDSPADAVRIAYVAGWTSSRAWDWEANQNSNNVVGGPIPLEAGKKYYIAALYKEGGGGDNCAVAWQGPDSPAMSVIAGYYLSPFKNLWAWAPSPADGATGVALSPTLSWLPVVDAVSYDVYVDGALLVNTAGTSVPVGPLVLDKTYNWRVDTVTAGGVRKGVLWSFKVVNNQLIDDFSSYDPVPEKIPPQFIVGAQAPLYGPMRLHAKLDETSGLTAADSSGNGNTGTLVGMGANQWVAGNKGGGLEFRGGNYVNCGTSSSLDVTADFTLAAWVKLAPNTAGNYGGIAGRLWQSAGLYTGFSLVRHSGNSFRLQVGNGTSSLSQVSSNTTYTDTNWHHVAGVRKGGVNYLYVDGVKQTATTTTSFVPSTNFFHVGRQYSQLNDRYFKGVIDDVRLYDCALTDAQIAGLADGTPSEPIPEQTVVGQVPAIYGPMRLYAKLNGNLNDSSGNGRNGTMVGGAPVFEAGKIGQAIHLDGVDDYVQFGAVGISGLAPRTVAAWAKADVLAGSMVDWINILGFTGPGGTDGHFDLEVVNVGGVRAYGIHVYGWEAIIMPIDLEWHHLAASYDGTTVKYYGDAKYVGSTSRVLNAPDNVRAGKRVDQVGCFRGLVDDARIYDYALSDNQIAGLAGAVAANPIGDTWSDLGLIDLVLDAGTMRVDTYSLAGLRYYLGEVSRATPFADLTAGGAKALSVMFRGSAANVAKVMYLALADSDGGRGYVLCGDDLTKPEWQEWNIDLRDLAGVNPAKSSEIAIGLVGLDGSIKADTLRFDDIRVYTSRCMPWLRQPFADLNDDCTVNVADLLLIAANWGYQAGQKGLWYEYYPEPPWIFGNDIQNAPFDTTVPRKQGAVNNFDITVRDQDDRFGFRFTGLIEVPADGAYTFYTSSDDGSMLYIGDTTVVDNRGWHGMQYMQGTINLTAGKHPITVTMFEDGGGEGLIVEYEGPGIARIVVPNDVLYRLPSMADLYPDGKVDWKDVFVMLDEWLDVQLWPY